MTADQIKAFWLEVDLIQQKHALFFPVEQKNNIILKNDDGFLSVSFRDGHNLSTGVVWKYNLHLSWYNDSAIYWAE